MPDNMKVAIVTDNSFLADEIFRIISEQELSLSHSFDFYCSANSPVLTSFKHCPVSVVNLRDEYRCIADNFDCVISAHCKQLFPDYLVEQATCANIHPGLNPYNRGWYPQVFGILNKLPWGATFHVIDKELDHGQIIAQKELEIDNWDTSHTAYEKVQEAEVELLEIHLSEFLEGRFKATSPSGEGNLNLKSDFEKLRQLDMDSKSTLREHIDLLRALSHGDYDNAYFIDKETGKKVYVKLTMKVADL